MAVSRASGIVQMPARASKMQSILFSTQNTYVTSPAGRPCAGLIGFRAKKGICKTTGGEYGYGYKRARFRFDFRSEKPGGLPNPHQGYVLFRNPVVRGLAR